MSEFNNSKTSEYAQIEIISVHVPKTAGTTFRNVLEQVYGKQGVILDYPGEHRKRFRNQLQARKDKIKVIHGHFDIKKYEKDFPQAKKIAWIRHPIHRLISHYFFWLKMPINQIRESSHKLLVEKQIGILEFSGLPDIKNLTVRFLNNRKIHDFYFIGIQEYFYEDILEIKERLGWPDFDIEYTNKNPASDYQKLVQEILEDSILLGKLEEINSEDMEFYREALKHREERKKILKLERKNGSYDYLNQHSCKLKNYQKNLQNAKICLEKIKSKLELMGD